MRRGEAGFTVIEVVIVIAVSGALLIGAFVAMTRSIDSTRFNDTMTATQSFMQKQYLEVLTGKSTRDTTIHCDASGNVTTGAANPLVVLGGSNCILLGRMITVDPGSTEILVHYIVGTEPATQVATSESDAIRAYNPKLVGDVADPNSKTRVSYELPWGAKVGAVTDPSGATVRYLAVLRSPISERILIYSNNTNALDVTTLLPANLNRKVDVCIDSGATGVFVRTGHMLVGAGQGQDLFTLERIGGAAC